MSSRTAVLDREAPGSPPAGIATSLRLVALVPSHNEESQIAATIESLLAQTRRPDEIIVVCDNCTDRTVEIALGYPVRVMETVGNTSKKAGALNQALDDLLPRLAPADAVLVMDADSVLEAAFLETALQRLARGDVCAVGGTFTGQPGGGLVGMFQRNEYARYARDVGRLKGKVLVLTGTATVFSVAVLTEVARARENGRLPGDSKQVYDVRVLTEDNELTLALLHLGHRIISPMGCRLTTEVMPTWQALAQQRLRWKRGALENLTDYGWTAITRRYWGRQLLSFLGVVVTLAYLSTVAWSFAVDGGLKLHPIWAVVTGIFILERVITVRSRGPAQMALAAVLVVEMAFDIVLQAVQARAFLDSAFRRERRW
ncbi:MAG: glycosyltransferase [Geodermatophilaceae bacterium]|nr:glycosyltransferase [Geodermatophilaceae bacterium]